MKTYCVSGWFENSPDDHRVDSSALRLTPRGNEPKLPSWLMAGMAGTLHMNIYLQYINIYI